LAFGVFLMDAEAVLLVQREHQVRQLLVVNDGSEFAVEGVLRGPQKRARLKG
jgi:hypothetical protein